MNRRLLLAAISVASALACLPPVSFAQAYPAKTVKIVAPVHPGAAWTSPRARWPSAHQVDGPVVHRRERSGGGGVIASQTVARAAPDGYTLMLGYVATHGTVPAVRKVPYDAVKDFTPIAMVVGTPNVLVVGAGVPVNDMKSLVEYAKKNKVSYGSAGKARSRTSRWSSSARGGFEAVHAPIAASARRSPTCSAARRR